MTSINYENFDQKLDKKDCDFEKIEKELLELIANGNENDPEIYWRCSRAAYQISLDTVNEDRIKAKTEEAFKYAKKAYELKNDCFQANKWMAITTGKLALLESDIHQKINCISMFLNHMKVCSEKNANDQMILFMHGRFQLALSMLAEDEKNLIKEKLGYLPTLDLVDAESKLQKSLEMNPDFIDNYITLCYLLIKSKKLDQAKEIVERGLTIKAYTKSDEMIYKELEKIKKSLT